MTTTMYHESLHGIGATGLTGGYEYDVLGRPTTNVGPQGYSYDAVGNITAGVDPAAQR